MAFFAIFFTALSWGLIAFFIRNDQGPPEPVGAIRSVFMFGVVSLSLTVVLSIPADLLFFSGGGISALAQGGFSNAQIFGVVSVHAFIEEFSKFFPLALAIYHRDFFNEVSDGVIYFAIIGTTFGAVENVLYALDGGSDVAYLRLFIGLFFHAGLTAFVGYFLAREKVLHKSVATTMFAFLVATILHALYNFGLFAADTNPFFILISLAITLTVNGGLFWLFYKATETDIKIGIAHGHDVEVAAYKGRVPLPPNLK